MSPRACVWLLLSLWTLGLIEVTCGKCSYNQQHNHHPPLLPATSTKNHEPHIVQGACIVHRRPSSARISYHLAPWSIE